MFVRISSISKEKKKRKKKKESQGRLNFDANRREEAVILTQFMNTTRIRHEVSKFKFQ